VPSFSRDEMRLYYGERGDPSGMPVVLTHGLLWSSRMMERVAGMLPDNRVLLLDLHGHGKSDKPLDASWYTWTELAADVVALLDHLDIEQAVVGGLSLGANVTLATAQQHPNRVAAMIVEMPVLQRGHPFARPAFTALASVYAAGRLGLAPAAAVVNRLPVPFHRMAPELAAVRDMAGADPRVAAAVLRGLLGDEPVPEDEASLAKLTMPALVIGHRNDPLHSLEDARELAERLPNGRFVEASSIAEFRLRPDKLAAVLRDFLDGVGEEG
jgi:pimeloyl-ACP methyl ester carboxylesterase